MKPLRPLRSQGRHALTAPPVELAKSAVWIVRVYYAADDGGVACMDSGRLTWQQRDRLLSACEWKHNPAPTFSLGADSFRFDDEHAAKRLRPGARYVVNPAAAPTPEPEVVTELDERCANAEAA